MTELEKVKSRLREDRSFAEVTVSRMAKNLERWVPRLSADEIKEAYDEAKSILAKSEVVANEAGINSTRNDSSQSATTVPKPKDSNSFEIPIDDRSITGHTRKGSSLPLPRITHSSSVAIAEPGTPVKGSGNLRDIGGNGNRCPECGGPIMVRLTHFDFNRGMCFYSHHCPNCQHIPCFVEGCENRGTIVVPHSCGPSFANDVCVCTEHFQQKCKFWSPNLKKKARFTTTFYLSKDRKIVDSDWPSFSKSELETIEEQGITPYEGQEHGRPFCLCTNPRCGIFSACNSCINQGKFYSEAFWPKFKRRLLMLSPLLITALPVVFIDFELAKLAAMIGLALGFMCVAVEHSPLGGPTLRKPEQWRLKHDNLSYLYDFIIFCFGFMLAALTVATLICLNDTIPHI